MKFTIFEDSDSEALFPLNQLRASFELRCGAFTNIERIQHSMGIDDEIQFIVREEIKDLISDRYPNIIVNPDIISPGILLNGQALWTKEWIEKINVPKSYAKNGKVIALHNDEEIPIADLDLFIKKTSAITLELDISFIHKSWDPIFLQNKMLIEDAKHFVEFHFGKMHPSVVLENSDNIFVGNNSEIRAGSVLDASAGPIIIDENVFIDIGSLIQGPIYIGSSSIVNPGAKLRKNISLGPMCKIGGEIEDVIFQGFSNKQHDGFIGHSYIGEWVNLGANTNNSDLKNNYSSIRIVLQEKEVDTNHQLLGSIIGDYVRTGISTMLNTGTIVGTGANIFGSGFQPKSIASFQWGVENKTDLDKFFQTIEKIKKRRGKNVSDNEKSLLSKIYLDSV